MSARATLLRAAYIAGLCAIAAITASAGAMVDLFGFPDEMRAALWPSMMLGFAVVAAPMLLLTFRPYWWGKLFVLWPAVSWIGFAGAMTFISGWAPILFVPLLSGGVMIFVAIVHHVIDPRFSGAPLR